MQNNRNHMLLRALLLSIAMIFTGCSHTIHGMGQDINEDTGSNKRTVTVETYPSAPTSPAPLQTPTRQ